MCGGYELTAAADNEYTTSSSYRQLQTPPPAPAAWRAVRRALAQAALHVSVGTIMAMVSIMP